MTGIVFIILFCLNFVVFSCEGKINEPPGGNSLIVAPGTDVKIEWSFDNVLVVGDSRNWFFMNTNTGKKEKLAVIFNSERPTLQILKTSLPGVEITKPATLILKAVDLRYNGTYQFSLTTNETVNSYFTLIVAVKPTVTVNCPSPMTVNEGDDTKCQCKGEGGNPPATVTWYKDGAKIGNTGSEAQTLTFTKVKRAASGTYICEVAQGDTLKNETMVELVVNFKPDVPSLTSEPEIAVLGKPVTIKCETKARPSPNYIILHNDTTISTKKTYTIDVVNASHAGSYKCIANNTIGRNSKDYTLVVTAENPENNAEESSDGLGGGAIAGIVIGVLLLLVIIIVVVWWCKFRGNKNQDRRTAASGRGDRSAPVYADVRKDPKSNEPTYAVLDKNALNTGGDTTAKRDSGQPTQYADIEFGVRGDLV